jgi:hypothetical protein
MHVQTIAARRMFCTNMADEGHVKDEEQGVPER